MLKISKNEFILKAVIAELPLEKMWMVYVLTIPLKVNPYINIVDGNYIVTIDSETFVITDATAEKPLVSATDKIDIKKDTLKCLNKDITTTITNFLVNYIVLEFGLNGEYDYINESFDPSNIWVKYVSENIGYAITIEDYLRYSDACLYVRQFSSMVVISSTYKMITAAPGIDVFKEKKYKQYLKAHGDKVFEDPIKIAEFEAEVKEYDSNYLKDDPALNIMISKKIQNQSRKLKYVSIGKPQTLIPDTKSKFILESLKDGIPNDPEAISSIFTGIRVGSYARGNETKDSGLAAKNLIRPTRGFVLDTEDCHTEETLELLVTEENHSKLRTRYYVVGGELKYIGNTTEKLIGKTINLRDPLFCSARGDRFCKACIGDILYSNKNSILLLTISAGGKGLSQSLSKFHFKGLELTTLNIDALFK